MPSFRRLEQSTASSFGSREGQISRSLTDQIAAIRQCVASAAVSDDVRASAEAGVASLEWVNRNDDLIRTVWRVMQNKAVKSVMESFAGAEVFPAEGSRS